MKNEINSEMLTRFLAGGCSPDEEKSIRNWLELSDENKRTFKVLEKVWKHTPADVIYQDTEEAWQRFVNRTGLFSKVEKNKRSNWKINKVFIRYAAAILIILLPFLVFSDIFNSGNQQILFKELFVRKGNRQSIILPDGTKITLDAGSVLKYPEEFLDDKREVILEGEAFFEVESNPKKPFVVRANQGEIKVLGTKFNVRSWKETKKVILTVSEGKVHFKNPNIEDEGVVLKQGESSTISGDENPEKPYRVDVNKYLAWMKNEIYFENTPLQEVISQLERWYDVTVILKNESAKNDTLTINIRNKSHKENFDFLALVTGYDVSYQGKVITLY